MSTNGASTAAFSSTLQSLGVLPRLLPKATGITRVSRPLNSYHDALCQVATACVGRLRPLGSSGILPSLSYVPVVPDVPEHSLEKGTTGTAGTLLVPSAGNRDGPRVMMVAEFDVPTDRGQVRADLPESAAEQLWGPG